MNRAWIPAGALAGVSVAGLIALGPLTDSMGTPVPFPTTVPCPSSRVRLADYSREPLAGHLWPSTVTPASRSSGSWWPRRRVVNATNINSWRCRRGRSQDHARERVRSRRQRRIPKRPRRRRPSKPKKQKRATAITAPGERSTPTAASPAVTAAASRLPRASSPRRPAAATEQRGRRDAGWYDLALGAIAQLGERLDRTQEVSGSSPLSSTRYLLRIA